MFRDSKVAIALILIIYALIGTMDFADQTAREQAASTVTLAKH